MKEKSSAVAIIKNCNNEILFLKRFSYDRAFPDIYCLPGGKIDENEAIVDALHREVKEETDLDVVKEEYIGYHTFSNETTTFNMHMFICDVKGDIKISDEHECYGFLDLDTTVQKIGINTITALNKYYKKI